jgi:carboxyl-terminal processing protease
MWRKYKRWGIAIPVLTTAIILFSYTNPGERYFEIAKNLDIFATMFKEVNTYYVDEVNPNTFMRAGIDAMLSSLDPYTNYIPEDDIEDYRFMTTNQYGGIGAVIGRYNNVNRVMMPYEGFPAYEGGLRIGDELIKVDGVDVIDKNTSEISKLLKGQANTEVTIQIKRYGVEEPITINLIREKITIDNVPYYGFVSDGVGYIKLSDFTTSAGKEVSKALTKLKEEGATKIILDLRENPGGLLSEAVNVTNIFIPRGKEIVSTKGKVSDWNKTYNGLNNPVDTEIPLVVMTDQRSASASEIVSGTIQDYDRGVLVGKKTFGKGLVQATRPLSYNSQLKVTTAKYYIPSGRCIQAINYSERNEDGSVKRIPDSLKVEFTTQNGRVVYDGGGIDPDILVGQGMPAPISISLVTKGLIFNYATHYYYSHESIGPAADFKLTDEEFTEFIAWLEDKDYDYTTRVEKTLDDLIKLSKEEKFNGMVEETIAELKKEIHHNKEKDLLKFQDEIRSALEEDIVSRYYLSKGLLEASFDDDLQLQEAIQVLNDPERYNQLLAKPNND